MLKPNFAKPVLFGGLIIGLLFGVPILNYANCLCCAPVMLGGFLSVFFYKKDLLPGMPPLQSSDGIKLGALSGAIGGVIATVIGQFFQLFTGEETKAEFDRMIEQMQGQPGANVLEMMRNFIDSPIAIIVSLVVSVILCTIFGLLGGLIGYSVLKPKQEMMNVPPPNPPTQMP
ncbi:MAG: hypothetical protein HY961_01135 [Ignavibacteriae bacterium]|nr:hypothetical protein [Ignavibacteriota bacterium]